jgi:hypothetical protein
MKKSLRIALAIVALLAGVGTVRAQDNLDYYWFENSGNWNDVNRWRVFRDTDGITPAGYVIPTELPDATNAVFINGATPAGTGMATPLSIAQNAAPAVVDIAVGTVGTAPLANSPFAAKSISFGGTIPNNTTVNFTINQPLTVGSVATPGGIAVNYRVAIRVNNALNVNGPLTFGATATGPTLLVNEPTTITGLVNVNTNATITANNELKINGDLTIANANARLNIDKAVFFGGSLSTVAAANLAGTAGSVNFTAAAPAFIRSTAATEPARVITFNVPVAFNGAGWTLNNNTLLNVNQNVTFEAGHLTAPNETNMISFGPGARAIAPKLSSHVNGFVQKRNLMKNSETVVDSQGNGFFLFPVGSVARYRPFVVAVPSNTATTFTARYFPVNPANSYTVQYTAPTNVMAPLTQISEYEYWFLKQVTGSNNYRVQLSYDFAPDPNPNYYTLGRTGGLAVAGYKNNKWESMGTTLDGTNKSIRAEGAFNIVQVFTIGRINAPLPVRLVSFSAQQLDGQVQLKWQSAEEKNTSHFEIERSADGKNFSALLTKKAQGNSVALVSYQALDNSPVSGTSYYRLKMVDLDGTFEYSKMVSVSNEGAVWVRAYPNPSNGREVQFQALNGDKLVLQTVVDAFGKAVGFEVAPVYGVGLYVNFHGSLPAGFYVATLITDDDKRERVRVKFVVQ